MSRRLRGGVPRARVSHKTREAYLYRVYVCAKFQRFPTLGPDAMPTLREAELVNVELRRFGQELRAPRLGRRDRARRRRPAIVLRPQQLLLERRLLHSERLPTAGSACYPPGRRMA